MVTYFPEYDFEAEFNDFSKKPVTNWASSRIGAYAAKLDAAHLEYPRNRFNPGKTVPLHKLMEIANDSFGFDGWSRSICDMEVEINSGRRIGDTHDDAPTDGNGSDGSELEFDIAVSATIKVTLKDGTYNEAQAIAKSHTNSKIMAIERCKRQALSDATRFCFEGFTTMILTHQERLKAGYYGR
ncbi:unnamed protein product [Kuraishia capsulata CBS 1993]|uniref:DNA repair protein RAD59 n=1 Tax=Kuraishia capsulata CBS 1993 TaxID=1382522 RepID=W6MHJ4_9ASCO|nr:uncharacterized protein KUCA_T00001709001 [Kuraishia capsulata CBS 1993]CDK25739.1 unnamed protein product [Kuraishia capsulata CBS 1993]